MLLTCFGLTVVFDMVVAVSVGVVLAALLFMRRMAEITHARLTGDARAATPSRRRASIPPELASKVASTTSPARCSSAPRRRRWGAWASSRGRLKVLIIRLDHVPVMDATGLVALESAIATLTKHGCLTVLTGLQPQPRALIERAELSSRPWRLAIRPDLAAAIAPRASSSEGARLKRRPSASARTTSIGVTIPAS